MSLLLSKACRLSQQSKTSPGLEFSRRTIRIPAMRRELRPNHKKECRARENQDMIKLRHLTYVLYRPYSITLSRLVAGASSANITVEIPLLFSSFSLGPAAGGGQLQAVLDGTLPALARDNPTYCTTKYRSLSSRHLRSEKKDILLAP